MLKNYLLVLAVAVLISGCNEDLGDKAAPSSGASPGSILALLGSGTDSGSGSDPEGVSGLASAFSFDGGLGLDSGADFSSDGPPDSVNANPEPNTLVLIGIGLAGLAARLKKRKF